MPDVLLDLTSAVDSTSIRVNPLHVTVVLGLVPRRYPQFPGVVTKVTELVLASGKRIPLLEDFQDVVDQIETVFERYVPPGMP